MQTLLLDIRYALRSLLKSPGFTAVAILTLALGIGANTAIFSVVNAVLLRPLPFKNQDRLVTAFGRAGHTHYASISPPDFLDYRAQNSSFEQFAAMMVLTGPANLAGTDKTEQVLSTMVTDGFFEALGTKPLYGRTFIPDDEKDPNGPQAVILGYGLWKQHFAGDSAIVSKNVNFNGRSVTVVGIAPQGFVFPRNTELWFAAPLRFPHMSARRAHFLRPIGLLKKGVSIQQAQADLDTIAKRLESDYPDSNTGWGAWLTPLREVLVGRVRPALLIILGAVAMVLLIACANVSNLLLARNTARRKELAIRAAIGANRWRLMRLLLTENFLVVAVAGGIAIFLAVWGVELLTSLGPVGVPRLSEVRVDASVLTFTALVSILTGLLFGLGPAFQSARGDLHAILKEGGRTSGISLHHRLRGLLVVGEVSLSLLLLVAAGLLLGSFYRLVRVSPGFRSASVLSTRILLSQETYPNESKRAAFFEQLMEKISASPTVESAGAISELPLTDQRNDTYVKVEGHTYVGHGDEDNADFRIVTPNYFQTMGIPILSGRGFAKQDRAGGAPVVIVSEPFVREFFHGMNPVGKHLTISEPQPVTREIVGIVGGIKSIGLDAPAQSEMYAPHAQQPSNSMNIVVRTTNSPALSAAVRSAVLSLDKDEAVSTIQTMEQVVSRSVAQPRFSALLLGLFALLALVLAAAGIYGVISYTVTQRTREIGVRMALGAQPRDVLRLVIGQGMALTLAGVTIGLVAALAASRLLANQLFGVTATDPATFAGVTMLLAAVALLACYVPARRATRVDPLVALRYE